MEEKMLQPKRRLVTTAAMLLLATGCEHQNHEITMGVTPQTLRSATPVSGYHLAPGEREKVVPGYDVAALERLLAHIIPERRTEILKYFQFPDDRSAAPLGLLMVIKDPQLQPLLEEVWAPMWDHVGATDEQVEENVFGYPGRALAMERRAARKREATNPR
jgi:hypothetical protein